MSDAAARKCPLCGKPVDPRYRPFCGKRCADLDLAHWFRERYRVPAVESEEDSEPEADEKR